MGKDYKRLLEEYEAFEAKRKIEEKYQTKKNPQVELPRGQSSFVRSSIDVV